MRRREPTERRVLSSLELVPEECQDDVVWALGELNQRRRTQSDILFELNDRLAVKGAGPISKSAFSRRSVRLSRRAAQLEERKYIYAGIAAQLTPEAIGQSDVVLGEFLKTLVDELLDAPDRTPEDAMQLARAYKDIIIAQRHSAELRRKSEEAGKAKLEKAVKAATDEIEKAGHKVDGAQVLELIRQAYTGAA